MTLTYVLKKFVGALASPLVFALFFVAAAGLLRWRGHRRTSLWLVVSAAVMAYLGSIEPVGDALLGALERKYAPLAADSMPQVAHVVVLGSGYEPRDGIPVTAALDPDGLARIVEGVRLLRMIGSARLVVSGGAAPGTGPPAIGYARLARQLGVPEGALIVVDTALDTRSEAMEISALLGDAPFILVTSASHMPRAMLLMRTAGAHPIAAPTAHRVDDNAASSWRMLLPTSDGLRKSEQALHEYLAFAAAAVGVS